MKVSNKKISNIVFIVIIALLIIPQTRKPIQVFISKGLGSFSPSVIDESKREQVLDYKWDLNNITTSESVNFSQSEGKVVLINFWATWCPPCVAEMPSLHDLYADYGGKVDFYFVSNEKTETINAFLKKHNYNFEVHNPVSTYPGDFDVSSIPRTFLIDKQGYIVMDKTGAANWNSEKVRKTINELLNK